MRYFTPKEEKIEKYFKTFADLFGIVKLKL